MRAVSTTVAAAALTVATLSLSSSAASLDVEPVETTAATAVPELPGANVSAANATSDGKIGVQGTCTAMAHVFWENFKYACHWDHSTLFDKSYNMFFMSNWGSVVKECECDKGLWNYAPWGSSWTFSVADFNKVACYSRDGRKAVSVKHEFDAHSCS